MGLALSLSLALKYVVTVPTYTGKTQTVIDTMLKRAKLTLINLQNTF